MNCQVCKGTGYYGDTGPGIRGNEEYVECEFCRAERKITDRKLLTLVWDHMHGRNLDGTRRSFTDEKGVTENWNALSEMIGEQLDQRRI